MIDITKDGWVAIKGDGTFPPGFKEGNPVNWLLEGERNGASVYSDRDISLASALVDNSNLEDRGANVRCVAIRHVDWAQLPTPAGDSTQATTFMPLPVVDTMTEPVTRRQIREMIGTAELHDSMAEMATQRIEAREAAHGVGDINGTEQGSGARYNAGKAPFELIPLRTIGTSYIMRGNLSPEQLAAAHALQHLGDFQSRRRGVAALYDVFFSLGFDGWEECARVFDYGRNKYAAWNWSRGMAWSIPLACAARHLLQILRGEKDDRESGLPHRGHVFCNVVMSLTFVDTYADGDDLPKAGLLAPQREAAAA